MRHGDPLLDEFDVEQLQRALQRRRPDSQLVPQPLTNHPADTSMDILISPTVAGFSTTGIWPDTSIGVLSECGAPPSTDMDADLAFWASLAGWQDSELALPPIESGTSHWLS